MIGGSKETAFNEAEIAAGVPMDGDVKGLDLRALTADLEAKLNQAVEGTDI